MRRRKVAAVAIRHRQVVDTTKLEGGTDDAVTAITVSALSVITVAWLGGLVIGAVQQHSPWEGIAPLLGLAALLWTSGAFSAATGAAEHRWRYAVVALVAVAAGYVAGPRATPESYPQPGFWRLRGVVGADLPNAGRRCSRLEIIEATAAHPGLSWPPHTSVRLCGAPVGRGARVELGAAVRPRVPFRNPTPHPRWPDSNAVVGDAQWIPATPLVIERRIPALEWLESWRRRVRQALARTLPATAVGMAQALVLGDPPPADDDATLAVRDAGVAHVLAVSGMHVTLVAGFLLLLIRRLLVLLPALAGRYDSRRLAAALGIPLAFAYALFAGGQPSAWRAACTASLSWGLLACGRVAKPTAVLASATLGLSALEPTYGISIGFLLSVFATAVICTPSWQLDDPPPPWGRRAARESLRAIVATAPLVLWCFGSVPLVGVAANVVLAPLGSFLLLPLAHLHAANATAAPAWSELSASFYSWANDGFIAACQALSGLSTSWQLPPLDAVQGCLVAIVCGLSLWHACWRRKLVAIAIIATALAAQEWRLRRAEQPHGELRATFLDVGQGDSTLVDLPDGRLMLVDAGGSVTQRRDPGELVLRPLLAARRRQRIDVVVISHAHPDHYGGLRALLGQVAVGEIWDVGKAWIEEPDGDAAKLLRRFSQAGARLRFPADLCDRPQRYGGATATVLWPCPSLDSTAGHNDNSLVLRLQFGDKSILFTGDIEAAGERALLLHLDAPRQSTQLNSTQRHDLPLHDPLRSTVLKVAHHGSRGSTTDAFLERVRPQLAVISSGLVNPFGHPHAELLQRLQRHRIRTLRIATHGGHMVRTDGRVWFGVKGDP